MVRFALMLATLAVLAVAVLTAGPPTAELRTAIAAAARLQEGGDLEGAAAAFARVRDDAGAGTRERAEALLGLAAIETDLGRYDAAGADANAAAGIFTLLGDASAASAAANQSGLAALFEGRYPAADAAFRRALAAAGPSGDPDARAEQLGNLGNVHFFTGQYADAARLYDEALRLVDSNRDRVWAARRRRILLANQATLEQRLGRDETALTLYRELDGSSADLAPSEQAQLLVNLGVLYRRLGDPIKALDMYERARRLFVQDRHADGELGVLKNRGIVLAIDLGRLDEAERTFTEVLTTATRLGNQREIAHALIYRGETRRRAGAMTDAHADFAAALRLARALAMPEEVWKALYGLGRTDVDPGAAAAHLDEAIDTIERIREAIRIPSRRSDFLNDKREVFDARLAASLAGGADVAAIFALLERSHSRGWRERLGLSATVSLQAVQAALPDDGLLLDYWHADNGAAVIAVSRHRAEVLPIRAPAAAVAAYADRWALSPGARGATLDLLPPASWFTGVRHVIVVPDGPLARVPFEVLAAADRPLIERAAVSYLPTAAALLRASPALPWRLPPWHTMLRAFGDPIVGPSTLDDAGRVRGRIAATGREVRTIASEIAGRSDLYLGAADRKEALLADGVPPLLHVATHALADTQALEQSRILFSPPRGQLPATADYLFLREVYDLTLDGVDLAVLSACETERGRLVRGEGIESFSRAFLAAGARSTVTTLWRVEDEPTADFMAIFYHQLQRGVPRDEALRQAKLRFLQSGPPLADPHYWAAFVLNGDALRPIPRAIAWKTVALSGLAVTAVVVLAVAVRRGGRAS